MFSKIFAVKIHVGMNLDTALTGCSTLKAKIIEASRLALNGQKKTLIIEHMSHDPALYYCYEMVFDPFYKQHAIEVGGMIMLCIRNITQLKLEERRQHEQQAELYTASKRSTIDQLSSVLIHEISQPLTAIMAYGKSCSIMIKNTHGYERFKKILPSVGKMMMQARHAWDIMDNMKKFISDTHFSVAATDINLLIQEALSILNYELLDFKLKITLNLMQNLPNIMVNKIHIMQVILNLARNSIESLKNQSEKKPELIIKTQEIKGSLVIHVIDNGSGIAAECLDKLFESPVTTKLTGTGIGLCVCRSLVEAHGGKINIQNHTQNGAWFTFTLPIGYLG